MSLKYTWVLFSGVVAKSGGGKLKSRPSGKPSSDSLGPTLVDLVSSAAQAGLIMCMQHCCRLPDEVGICKVSNGGSQPSCRAATAWLSHETHMHGMWGV